MRTAFPGGSKALEALQSVLAEERTENVSLRIDRSNLEARVQEQREELGDVRAENAWMRTRLAELEAVTAAAAQTGLVVLAERDAAQAENTRLKEEASRDWYARRDAENGAAKLRDENTRLTEERAFLRNELAHIEQMAVKTYGRTHQESRQSNEERFRAIRHRCVLALKSFTARGASDKRAICKPEPFDKAIESLADGERE